MPVSVNELNGDNGFKITVGGRALDLHGDFNGNTYDDIIIIGSPATNQTSVLFGRRRSPHCAGSFRAQRQQRLRHQPSGALYFDPDGTGAAAMVQFATSSRTWR